MQKYQDFCRRGMRLPLEGYVSCIAQKQSASKACEKCITYKLMYRRIWPDASQPREAATTV